MEPGSSHAAMPAAHWSHMAFARAADILGRRAGLRFPPNRQHAAESAMKRAMEDAGISDGSSFVHQLENDERLLARLLTEVTIGESYFFREPAQLDYIRRQVLPTFRGERDRDRPLRLWSAGCASGEEAYTLAIILRESGWSNAGTVLGTDISGPRIGVARRGRYTAWSLRGVAEEEIERYFTRQRSHFLLRPHLRAAAHFDTLNLAGAGWPGGTSGIGEMDIILCRNVLIYFDRPTATTVASRLLDSLSADGWLFLGASDPMLADELSCDTVVTGAGLAYRRAEATGNGGAAPRVTIGYQRVEEPDVHRHLTPPRTWMDGEPPSPWERDGTHTASAPTREQHPVPAVAATPRPELAAAAALYAGGDYAAAAELARELVRRSPAADDGWALLVRSLANAGQTVQAEEACEAALELHRVSPELAHLHALLLNQRGQHAAAAAAARRAIYLDRSLVLPQLALATALTHLGYIARARQLLRSAERLLAQLDDTSVVPLGDGETVHRIREVARAQLQLLDRASS